MCKISIFVSIILFLGVNLCFAEEASITFTTYFPSPNGAFQELGARKSFAVGDISDSGTSGVDEVEDLQYGELFVEDSAIFKSIPGDPATWSDGKEGELAYSKDKEAFYYFDGTDWKPL